LADTGRLLARHWPALVAVAVVAEVLHELALRAALAVAPSSGVLGLLVLCFSPLATVVGIVVMLHVLRREPRSGRDRLEARTLLGSIASVLVPYLVIYEFYGGLTSDWQTYVDSAALDHAFAAGSGIRTASPIPEGFGVTVLAVVAGALLARTRLDRLARRLDRRGDRLGVGRRRRARRRAAPARRRPGRLDVPPRGGRRHPPGRAARGAHARDDRPRGRGDGRRRPRARGRPGGAARRPRDGRR